MLDILYYIFIFPVEGLLQFLIDRLFKISISYGCAIIYLSILLNLLLLKLSFYFDSKAKKFNALKKQCDSKIAEFKRVFKGAELQSYIRILYRQKGFHPIYALSGLGGLALQIPFFIAMIHLVENAQFLQNVSFLWIADLSKPDSITLLGFSIHLLPILMTLFTLINVFYSSRELGARIQGSVIALLFLVLLYSMPSALVLYWTCNMVFALGRSVLSDFSGSASLASLQRTPSVSHSQGSHNPKNSSQALERQESNKSLDSEISESSTQTNAPMQKANSSIADEVRELSKNCAETNTTTQSGNSKILSENASKTAAVSLSDFGGFGAKGEGSYLEGSDRSLSEQSAKSTKETTQKLKRLFNAIFTPHNALSENDYKLYRNISILAILNICFMICVFSPYAIYSSDVSQFDVKQTYPMLSALFGIFLTAALLIIYLTSFLYKSRLLKLGAYGLSVALCIGLVYTFALDYNVVTGESYSQLDNFVFKTTPTYNRYMVGVDVLIGISFCIIVFYAMRYCLWPIYRFFLVVCVSIVAMSVFSLGSIYKQHNHISAQIANSSYVAKDLQDYLPPFHHDLTAFSKNDQNVLVLLFDGFSGSHLQMIFEQFPELKEAFSGFTYYPNTISLDGNTSITAHTILSGFKTSAFNQRNGNIEAFDKAASDALRQTYMALRDKGFNVQSYGMPHAQMDKSLGDNISIYSTQDVFSNNQDYSLYYENMLNLSSFLKVLRNQNRPIGELVSMGLFYFSPYSLRRAVYARHHKIQNGIEFADYAWIFATDKLQHIQFLAGINTTSQLPSIVRNLNTDAQGKTFKYIHTLHTHYPFVLDSQTCEPTLEARKTQLPEQYRVFFPYPHHYDNEICAIKETITLLNFLKNNHIYNNTMIVLVSDHSYDDLPAHNMPNSPSFGNAPNPLLLIKDFNSTHSLKTDWRLMSNADVYGILCETFSICSDERDIRKHYPPHREIIHTRNVQWTDEARKMPKLYLEKVWVVKDNVLDPNSFTDITESVQNGTFKIDGINH